MRKRVLPMLVLALGCLLAACAGALNWLHQARLAEITDASAHRTQLAVDAEFEKYTKELAAALETIVRDDGFRKSLAARDADALYRQAKPLFDRLHALADVDHFYFHATDRTCLLRVHEPAHRGDVINRESLRQAQRTGKPATGVEQGPTGNCVLRTVYPVRDAQQNVIGYAELGTEFEPLADAVRQAAGIDLALLVDKSLLSEQAWQKRNVHAGRQSEWGTFPDVVMVESTFRELPAELARRVTAGLREGEHFEIAPAPGRTSVISVLPFQDEAGRSLGQLIAARDVTVIAAQHRTAMWLVVSACVAVGAALAAFLHEMLGKVQAELESRAVAIADAQAALAQTNASLANSNAELSDASAALESRVAERTRELEQRAAEQAVAAAAATARLARAQRISRLGDWDWDLARNEMGWSDECARIFGVVPGTVRPTHELLLKLVHPGDRDALAAKLAAARSRGAGDQLEYRIVRPDGAVRHIESQMEAALDAGGTVAGFVGVVQDVTERKQAEAALDESERLHRSMVDALPLQVAVLDESGRIVSTNQAWREGALIVGATDAAECAVGANYLAVCDAAAIMDGNEHARAAAAGIRRVIHGEAESCDADYPSNARGTPRWFAIRVTRFADDRSTRLIVIHQDVTERKLAELQRGGAAIQTDCVPPSTGAAA